MYKDIKNSLKVYSLLFKIKKNLLFLHFKRDYVYEKGIAALESVHRPSRRDASVACVKPLAAVPFQCRQLPRPEPRRAVPSLLHRPKVRHLDTHHRQPAVPRFLRYPIRV